MSQRVVVGMCPRSGFVSINIIFFFQTSQCVGSEIWLPFLRKIRNLGQVDDLPTTMRIFRSICKVFCFCHFSDPQDPQESNFLSPHFTTETKVAPLHYFRKIGETFSVTCEALGNPIPEIVWLKNGQKFSSGANYIHAGKSSLELVVLDSSDVGLYSCM